MEPKRDEEALAEQAAQERRESVKKAFELLEQNLEFHGARVRIDEREQEVEKAIAREKPERLSESRFDYCIRLLDIEGEEYLRLVVNLESHKAYATVIDDLVRRIFIHFSGIPIEVIPPTLPFAPGPPPPEFQYRDKLLKRGRHWVIEGHRRLADLHSAEHRQPQTRKGYRSEIREWMQQKRITSVEKAAKRLAVSDSTLKSIMSDKGTIRYSAETLARILKEIGQPPRT